MEKNTAPTQASADNATSAPNAAFSLRAQAMGATKPLFWQVTASLAFIELVRVIMNVAALPAIKLVAPLTGQFYVATFGLVLLAVGGLATFKPHQLHARALDAAFLLCLIVGSILCAWAMSVSGRSTALTVFACLHAAGRAGVLIMTGLAAAALPLCGLAPAVALSFIIAKACSYALLALPFWIDLMLFFLLPFVSFALTFGAAQPVLDAVACHDAPADIAITYPSTFLPLGSSIFLLGFLFQAVFGFSLSFSPLQFDAGTLTLRLLPVLAAGLYLGIARRPDANGVWYASTLFIIAGFGLFMGDDQLLLSTGTGLLSSGEAVFRMVFLWTLLTIAARNHAGALASFAWGMGVAGFGSPVGVGVGAVAVGVAGASWQQWVVMGTAIIVVFLACVLFGMRNLDIRGTMLGIRDADAESVAIPEEPEELFGRRCAEVAEQYGLTPRETEVLGMLARGRDATYIQETLVISRNTVKVHIRHVYAKLDIHSQQDLIAIVQGD